MDQAVQHSSHVSRQRDDRAYHQRGLASPDQKTQPDVASQLLHT